MWSPADGNLSYLCLGDAFLLAPETFNFKNFETLLSATYNNGRVAKYYTFWLPFPIRYLEIL